MYAIQIYINVCNWVGVFKLSWEYMYTIYATIGKLIN